MTAYDSMLENYRMDERLQERRRIYQQLNMLPNAKNKTAGAKTLQVKKLLAQAGITQTDAAQRLGISRETLNHKLAGRIRLTQREMMELTEMAKERLEAEWT